MIVYYYRQVVAYMTEPQTYGLTHLAIAVNNVERTMRFYQSVFDMQIMYHHNRFVQLTTPGCNDIVVFEEKKDVTVGSTGGIAHYGFRLKNPNHINDIATRIINAGGTIFDKGEFVAGSPYVFFKNPEG